MQLNGEYSQAHILDAVVNSPIGNLAIFIYMIGAVGFFISVAVFQDYKMGLWLVLGPAFWDISANTRTESINVNWMYAGKVIQSQEWLSEFSNKELVDELNLQKGPATAYVLWDAVVSGTVQNLTGLLASIARDPATRLFAKASIQEGMLSSMIQTPEIRDAMKLAMGSACTPMMQISSLTEGKAWTPTQVSQLKTLLENRVVPNISEPIARRLCEYKKAFEEWQFGAVTPLENIDTEICQTQPWAGIGDETFGASPVITCYQFSEVTWQALQVEAELRLRSLYKAAGANTEGISAIGQNLLPDWSLNMLINDPESLRKLVGSYIVRNEVNDLQFLNPSEYSDGPGSTINPSDKKAAELVAMLEEKSAGSQAVFFAKAIPYLQGSLLYFLAIAYPFMCIITMIPGFHSSMITWMGAWAWVKSWDVMLYVANLIGGILAENVLHKGMLYDNIAQNQYPGTNGEITNFAENVVERLQDINFLHVAVFKAFSDMDPKFTAGIVNYIMALTTISIPAITGIFFLWGRASTLGLFSDAFKQVSHGASERTSAMLQDSWQRKIELDRQKSIRMASLAGTAIGVGSMAFGMGMRGGLMLTGIGTLLGEKAGSTMTGWSQGQQGALIGGRPMIVSAGDVPDGWELTTTGLGAMGLHDVLSDTGRLPRDNPDTAWNNSAEHTRLTQNSFGRGITSWSR